MIIIGITGSIGMGKSFVAKQFAQQSTAVFDADKEAHSLLAEDKEVIANIKEMFPSVVSDEVINRTELGDIVFNSPEKLAKLEEILHPRIRQRLTDFLRKNKAIGRKCVVLDIPLLFEKNWDSLCDFTIVVSAPPMLQQQRALQRNNMSQEKFNAVNNLQIPADKKAAMADYVIHTGLSKSYVAKQINLIMKDIFKS